MFPVALLNPFFPNTIRIDQNMSSISDLQMLLVGGTFAAAGISLLVDSTYTLQLLKPLTVLIEEKTGLVRFKFQSLKLFQL